MAYRTTTIEYEEFDNPDELSRDEQVLIRSARAARKYAHAPYSNFRVGSAVLLTDGRILTGSNQETSNFKGSCAEKVVLDSAGAAGAKNHIIKIAIVGHSTESDPSAPCGQCRQDIKEVEDLTGKPMIIILAGDHKVIRITGIENLLPMAFGKKNLKKHSPE